ncbi:MAG: phage holin [Eubacteriaceae bacterium]|jgi:phi LC3 family holin
MYIDIGKRVRSLPFWTAVASLFGLLLQQLCFRTGTEFDTGFYSSLTSGVLSILTLLGIIIDPSSPGFSDSDPLKPA